jgi:arsenic resistance protein ArsH
MIQGINPGGGRAKLSSYCGRVIDVMEELVKFTLLTRDLALYLVDRYSERKEGTEALAKRVISAVRFIHLGPSV